MSGDEVHQQGVLLCQVTASISRFHERRKRNPQLVLFGDLLNNLRWKVTIFPQTVYSWGSEFSLK